MDSFVNVVIFAGIISAFCGLFKFLLLIEIKQKAGKDAGSELGGASISALAAEMLYSGSLAAFCLIFWHLAGWWDTPETTTSKIANYSYVLVVFFVAKVLIHVAHDKMSESDVLMRDMKIKAMANEEMTTKLAEAKEEGKRNFWVGLHGAEKHLGFEPSANLLCAVECFIEIDPKWGGLKVVPVTKIAQMVYEPAVLLNFTKWHKVAGRREVRVGQDWTIVAE